jgi:hypothetical protein
MLCDFMLEKWLDCTKLRPLFPKMDEALRRKEAGASDEEIKGMLNDEDIRQAKEYIKNYEKSPQLCGDSMPFENITPFQEVLRKAHKFTLSNAFTGASLKRLATADTIMKAKEWFALIHDPMWMEWQFADLESRMGALLYTKPVANGDPAIMCYFVHGVTRGEMKWFEIHHIRLFPASLKQEGDTFKMDIEDANGISVAEENFKYVSTMIIFDFVVRLNSPRITEFRPPEDLSRINKKRLQLGKFPLCVYQVVDLNKEIQHYLKLAETEDGSGVRFHWRRGHFKARKTGIFWWNPHTAGRKAHGEIHKDYIA